MTAFLDGAFIALALPVLYVNLFVLVPRSWRVSVTSVVIPCWILIVFFDRRVTVVAVWTVMVAVVLVTQQWWWLAVRDEQARRNDGRPPLINSWRGFRIWWGPFFALRYRRKLLRDPDFLAALEEPGAFFDAVTPVRNLGSRVGRVLRLGRPRPS